LDAEFEAWIERIRTAQNTGGGWSPVRPCEFESSGDGDFQILDDGAVLLSGDVPDAVEYTFTLAPNQKTVRGIRIEALTDDQLPGKGPGRGDAKRTNFILSEVVCELVTRDATETITLTDAKADFSQAKWDVANAIDGDRKTGWAIAPQFGKPHWAQFLFEQPLDLEESEGQLRVTLVQDYGQGRVIGKPRLSLYLGDPVLYDCDEGVLRLATGKVIKPAQRVKLRAAFESNHQQLQRLDKEIVAMQAQLRELKPDSTLVMVEMDTPRATHVMKRGDYENLGEQVQPASPDVLPKFDAVEKTGDRRELAQWLTCRDNPLLARVTVNRWWASFFQAGIVTTLEDFGSQAEEPSHPELLDWLAFEFIDSRWSMKHVHKLIVMSNTFRQSARVTPAALAADPTNRWLARGPRLRLPAELIRDNALAMSGLLSVKMYGPPIMPYQPENVWRSVGRNQPKWKSAEGEDRFRRGVYVIWKRAAPYPSFVNFDAPDRSSCTVNRPRTNTPLQALTLLNDPAYAEMALAYADRILDESEDRTDEGRLRYAFRLAVSRSARATEIEVLKKLLDDERKWLARHENMVKARVRVPFAGMQLKTADQQELAAWFAVANALLNLDETMSQ
jgi:hypothetical protein